MGNESARVARDRRFVFAYAHAARGIADDPAADYRVVAVELRQRRVTLVDVAFGAVRAGLREDAAWTVDFDVRAFARVQRLTHVALAQPAGLEIRRQEIRMIGIELPQHRENRLAREQHFPRGLED